MKTPNRHKWDGWVTFAWLLAGIALVAGIFLVSTMGMMEVPERDFLGNVEMVEKPNPIVWSAAIGQFVASLLLAVIFSMLNSIYQNSCDLLSTHQDFDQEGRGSSVGNEETKARVAAKGKGVTVGYVNDASPLFGLVEVGHVILAINSSEVSSVRGAGQCLRDGSNRVAFLDHQGHLLERTFETEGKSSLGIKPA
ncbi:hypothetical protein NPJ88_011530 [Halomonas elongata]|uniref:hypothetical protein n=1 Tax=Halomonas elongata TaxID=2746 RepID=UPI00255B3D11|nr:hypothetical protein [Halomonas elongata]MDL4862967.1 hypothetical protein [Halomonas elongata]